MAPWYALRSWEEPMEGSTLKSEARRLVDDLPEEATWDDLMYRIYVRQTIEAGLKDSEAGRTVDVSEVRARFGLPR
jgi:predicted transcriptional regulator